MKPSRLFAGALTLLVVFGSAESCPANPPGDVKEGARVSEGEVERLRESLHLAQRELARKEERIEKLEKELRSAKETAKRKEKKRAKEKPAETAAEGPAQPKPRAAGANAGAAATAPTPGLFTVNYEKNSAVNYEGREAAMRVVRERIRRDPGIGFKIVGSANDSRYPEVNRDVAGNRARYLADFLTLSGIPGEAILSVEGREAKVEGEAGRHALVIAVERSARGEPAAAKRK